MGKRGVKPQAPSQRFWKFVKHQGDCWIWTGAKDKGYGRFNAGNRTMASHRFAYQDMVGDIPDGLQLDHLCRNPSCVNPDHLDPVPGRVNTLRAPRFQATACPAGHPYEGENLLLLHGKRRCRTCHNARSRESYRRKRQAKQSPTNTTNTPNKENTHDTV